MRTTVSKAFAMMMAYQLENTPNADDLDVIIQAYAAAFSDGLHTPEQIERRFHVWMNNESKWPTPADIRKMRISDYEPTVNTGQAPALGNDSRRLPLRSETVTAADFAQEHLSKMHRTLS